MECPICGSDAKFRNFPDVADIMKEYDTSYATYVQLINCPRCGTYYKPPGNELRSDAKPNMKLSSWLRENERKNNPIRVTDEFLEPPEPPNKFESADAQAFHNCPTPTLNEKLNKLLLLLEEKTEHFGQCISLPDSTSKETAGIEALSWAVNTQELAAMLETLSEQGMIDGSFPEDSAGLEIGLDLKITAHGFEKIESLRKDRQKSTQGFIAMWFHESMNSYCSLLKKAISESGFIPLRIDELEHANRIDDEILNQIRKSRFVICDLTGKSNDTSCAGAYFEAGYALGLDIPVIWTCRSDQFNERHFDIRQYNCIKWEKDALKTEEQKLIKSIKTEEQKLIKSICSRIKAVCN